MARDADQLAAAKNIAGDDQATVVAVSLNDVHDRIRRRCSAEHRLAGSKDGQMHFQCVSPRLLVHSPATQPPVSSPPIFFCRASGVHRHSVPLIPAIGPHGEKQVRMHGPKLCPQGSVD
ncbi:MAG: hypothetical protein A3I66_24180 [Burkholderiales bacterium RIFCSPLOWO2_02_FULL_57_36]|nr:MAG: hypothetical protein A3I66_24180 [Burkholderiales bacterium RIFCSPLOWO2_02_FULL_57_36]